ncbi:hypothetical protein D6745_01385 [Candidatus Woesearchaeota archaeon]|nr:MAG: hypothetical protein D6745_01385 [Candidatus Woesearchaeota archaeon]
MSRTTLNRNCMLVLAAFVMLFALAGQSLALGVAPTQKVIDFEPGQTKEVKIQIINDQQKDFKAIVYARGEMANYTNIRDSLVTVKANEKMKEFRFNVSMPSSIDKPGDHEVEIVVLEFGDDVEEKAIVTARVAVVSKLIVRVPYPGKYADAKLFINSANVNETVTFKVPIYNFGDEAIEEAWAEIQILGATYEVIGKVETNRIRLEPKSENSVKAGWLADVNAGVYHAVAIVHYDDKTVRVEENFEVGNLLVEVENVIVDEFRLGEIAKFDIIVKNTWNELLKDVYGDVKVVDEKGSIYTNYKTASIDIPAYSKGVLEAYWDTKEAQIGKYDLDITLHYKGKTSRKVIETHVNIDSITTKRMPTAEVVGAKSGAGPEFIKQNSVLIISVIILIIINIGWFIYFKKSKK